MTTPICRCCGHPIIKDLNSPKVHLRNPNVCIACQLGETDATVEVELKAFKIITDNYNPFEQRP